MTVSELPPTAEVLDALRYAVAPAAGAAAGVYAVAAVLLWRLTIRWRRWMPAAGVLALAAAVAAGNHFRGPFPWWPDDRWWHRGGPALAGAFAAGVLGAARGTMVGYGLAALAASAVVGWAVVPPDARHVFVESATIAAVTAGLWTLTGGVGRAGGPKLATSAMSLILLGGSAVLLHHKTIGFSDGLTVAGVALAVLLVLGTLTRTDPSAAAAVAVVPLVAMLALGHALADSDIPLWVFLLAGSLPLVPAARLVPWLARGRRPLVLFVLTALGVCVEVVAAMRYAPLRFGDDW